MFPVHEDGLFRRSIGTPPTQRLQRRSGAADRPVCSFRVSLRPTIVSFWPADLGSWTTSSVYHLDAAQGLLTANQSALRNRGPQAPARATWLSEKTENSVYVLGEMPADGSGLPADAEAGNLAHANHLDVAQRC